jgi:eukaryotic-like serine/threonine-protein kinase
VLDRGRERVASTLADQPGLRVALSGVLAQVYETLGDSATAATLIAEGDQVLASAANVDDRSRADFLAKKMMVLTHRGDLDETDRLAREVIVLQERLGDSFSRQYDARLTVMRTTLQRSDIAEWPSILMGFLHGIESDPNADTLLIARARALVGHNLTFAEQYEDAERLIRQALPVLEAGYPANHANVVAAHYGLGYVLARSGRAAEAVEMLEKSHREGAAVYGESSYQVARHDIRLAEAMLGAGRHEDAERVLQRSLATLVATHKPPHGDLIVAETGLGNLYMAMQRPRDAEQHLREALRQSEALGGGNQPLEMRTTLGRAVAAQGRFDEALEILDSGERLATPKGAAFVRWSVERSDVLHRLGRDDEARAALARAEPLLAANAKQLGDTADRAASLRATLQPR